MKEIIEQQIKEWCNTHGIFGWDDEFRELSEKLFSALESQQGKEENEAVGWMNLHTGMQKKKGLPILEMGGSLYLR